MSSPPYRSPAASPPHPAHSTLPNARKRPLSHATTQPPYPSAKKRKPSSFSTTSSNHPLRQTSFPPEESAIGSRRSPSIDSEITTGTGAHSLTAGAAGGGGGSSRKRGRRKKDATGSVKSLEKRSGAGDATSRNNEALNEEVDDDEGDDDGLDELDEGEDVDKSAEQKKIGVLIEAFSNEQSDRYDLYRRVKLQKVTIRKIVNQTLSQSVPPSVITTINGFTKVFVGTLIERARDIQLQEYSASHSLPSPSRDGSTIPASSDPTSKSQALESSQTLPATSPLPNGSTSMEPRGAHPEKTPYMGPLLVDHLREAFRRYRKDGEGGGAGVGGWSVGLGQPGSGSARLNGKRLFR